MDNFQDMVGYEIKVTGRMDTKKLYLNWAQARSIDVVSFQTLICLKLDTECQRDYYIPTRIGGREIEDPISFE